MASIYTHIDSNKKQTVVIVALFVAFISLIGWFYGQYFENGLGVFYLGLALVVSGISGFISYYNSDKIVLAISRARKIERYQNAYLHNLVENLCIGAGLPVPGIYMIDDSSMNAFATGRDPEHAVICVTSGIVDRMEKLELEGVIAHELSHIGNYDTRLMSIVSILVGSITMLTDFFTRGRLYGSRRKSSNSSASSILLLIGMVSLILSPIIATLIKLAISRRREYLADSTAALLTRYPDGLASALKKLSMDNEILEAANGATAHLYIVSPIKNGIGSTISNLFDTHPPIVERIRRLESM